MKLEDQVCSLDLAKRLNELGVKQDSLFYWGWYEPLDDIVRQRGGHLWRLSLGLNTPADCYALAEPDERYAAFTVAELGEMLPQGCASFKSLKDGEWVITPSYSLEKELDVKDMYAKTEAEARAAMLIYLLENKLITI